MIAYELNNLVIFHPRGLPPNTKLPLRPDLLINLPEAVKLAIDDFNNHKSKCRFEYPCKFGNIKECWGDPIILYNEQLNRVEGINFIIL